MSDTPFSVTRREFGLSLSGLTASATLAAAEDLGSAPWAGPAIVKKAYLGIPQPTWPKPSLDVKQEMAEVESNVAELERKRPGEVSFVEGELLGTAENAQCCLVQTPVNPLPWPFTSVDSLH